MRGGLDDALDKLARRDELRRRAANEATGTPAAVTELVEAIAAVVGRHPRLGVTVGVEGDGDPMVLRFFYDDGQVQVTAENNLTPQRHADFDVEVGEPVDEVPTPPYPGAAAHPMSHDDQDRFGPSYGDVYQQPAYYGEHDTAERRYGAFEQPAGYAPSGFVPSGNASHQFPSTEPASHQFPSGEPASHQFPSGEQASHQFPSGEPASHQFPPTEPASHQFPSGEPASHQFPPTEPGESSRDLGARMRDLGMASSRETPPEFPPHPLAPTPPPTIPPQTIPPQTIPTQTIPTQTTRRLGPEHYRPPFESTATERAGATERLVPPPEARTMPTPLPEPIPLKVERPEETEMAARRLAALLRDDPTLLSQRPE